MFGLGWDVKHRLLSSIEKAKKLLGYRAPTRFEDGLKKVHEWFVESLGEYRVECGVLVEKHEALKKVVLPGGAGFVGRNLIR